MATFKTTTTITALLGTRVKDKQAFEISSLNLMAGIGAGAQCSITVICAKPNKAVTSTTKVIIDTDEQNRNYLNIGDEVNVSFSYRTGTKEEQTVTLFSGWVTATTDNISLSGSGYGSQRVYILKTAIDMLEVIPLGKLSFQLSLGVNQQLRSSSLLESKETALSSITTGSIRKGGLNVAKAVTSLLDNGLTQATQVTPTKTLAGAVDVDTAPVLNLTTYPAVVDKIVTYSISAYNDVTPLEILKTVLGNFYQTLVPRFKLTAQDKTMAVISDLGWRKASKEAIHISINEVMESSFSDTTPSTSPVDAVAVAYALDGKDSVNLEAGTHYLYAEGRDASGGIVAIDGVAKQTPQGWVLEGAKNQSKVILNKVFRVTLPGWCVYQSSVGSEESTVTNGWKNQELWAKHIARATFSQLHRQGLSLRIRLPFLQFIRLRNSVGDILTVDIPTRKEVYVGRLETITVLIRIADTFYSDVSISLSHVRTQEEDTALSIDSEEILKVETARSEEQEQDEELYATTEATADNHEPLDPVEFEDT